MIHEHFCDSVWYENMFSLKSNDVFFVSRIQFMTANFNFPKPQRLDRTEYRAVQVMVMPNNSEFYCTVHLYLNIGER